MSDTAEVVPLPLDIGETALAFMLSSGMCRDLGRALMTVSAATAGGAPIKGPQGARDRDKIK
jgi:hypothetical protein